MKNLGKVLLYTIILISLSCYANTNELSTLTNILNSLTNIQIPKEVHAELGKDFYQKLQKALKDAINEDNPQLLDHLGPNSITEAAKFMLSLTREEYQTIDVINHRRLTRIKYTVEDHEFIALLKAYNRILANYDRTQELIITSLASGDLRKEYLLLRTLVKNGYNKIRFYGIDPNYLTTEALNSFKMDQYLKNIIFSQFNNADSYIKEKIKKDNELPNVCIIFGPYGDTGGNMPNLIKIPSSQGSAILTMSNNIDELGILSSDSELIDRLNHKLSTSKDNSKKNAINIFKRSFLGWIDHHSVILDFLEIIRLASSPIKDCIAYLVTGNTIVEYREIGTKSIAKLYSEFQGHYDDQRIKCPCLIFIYSINTNQFHLVDFT